MRPLQNFKHSRYYLINNLQELEMFSNFAEQKWNTAIKQRFFDGYFRGDYRTPMVLKGRKTEGAIFFDHQDGTYESLDKNYPKSLPFSDLFDINEYPEFFL